jgi:hypothetical protein
MQLYTHTFIVFSALSQISRSIQYATLHTADDTLPVLQPDLVLHTGDIVDGWSKNGRRSGEQHQAEWDTYTTVLQAARLFAPQRWVDLRGNHDAYGSGLRTSANNKFVTNGVYGTTNVGHRESITGVDSKYNTDPERDLFNAAKQRSGAAVDFAAPPKTPASTAVSTSPAVVDVANDRRLLQTDLKAPVIVRPSPRDDAFLHQHVTPFGKYAFLGFDAAPEPGLAPPLNIWGTVNQPQRDAVGTFVRRHTPPASKAVQPPVAPVAVSASPSPVVETVTDTNERRRRRLLQSVSAPPPIEAPPVVEVRDPANAIMLIGHYPLFSIEEPNPFTDALEAAGGATSHVSAYLCGHLHQANMHARVRGLLELELADLKKHRAYRLLAYDHDSLSFVDATLGEWPVVLVTHPKDARHLVDTDPIANMQSATHIRVVVASSALINPDGGEDGVAKVTVRIDDSGPIAMRIAEAQKAYEPPAADPDADAATAAAAAAAAAAFEPEYKPDMPWDRFDFSSTSQLYVVEWAEVLKVMAAPPPPPTTTEPVVGISASPDVANTDDANNKDDTGLRRLLETTDDEKTDVVKPLVLSPGLHRITIVATDTAGNTKTHSHMFSMDGTVAKLESNIWTHIQVVRFDAAFKAVFSLIFAFAWLWLLIVPRILCWHRRRQLGIDGRGGGTRKKRVASEAITDDLFDSEEASSVARKDDASWGSKFTWSDCKDWDKRLMKLTRLPNALVKVVPNSAAQRGFVGSVKRGFTSLAVRVRKRWEITMWVYSKLPIFVVVFYAVFLINLIAGVWLYAPTVDADNTGVIMLHGAAGAGKTQSVSNLYFVAIFAMLLFYIPSIILVAHVNFAYFIQRRYEVCMACQATSTAYDARERVRDGAWPTWLGVADYVGTFVCVCDGQQHRKHLNVTSGDSGHTVNGKAVGGRDRSKKQRTDTNIARMDMHGPPNAQFARCCCGCLPCCGVDAVSCLKNTCVVNCSCNPDCLRHCSIVGGWRHRPLVGISFPIMTSLFAWLLIKIVFSFLFLLYWRHYYGASALISPAFFFFSIAELGRCFCGCSRDVITAVFVSF